MGRALAWLLETAVGAEARASPTWTIGAVMAGSGAVPREGSPEEAIIAALLWAAGALALSLTGG